MENKLKPIRILLCISIFVLISAFFLESNLYAFQENPPSDAKPGYFQELAGTVVKSFNNSIGGLVATVVGSLATMIVAFIKRKLENSGKADMESLLQQMPDEMLSKMTPQDFINLIKASK